jgi:2,3-bisphosphoglycerate-dependent phosphoglycerate mutase|tara:strand:- start:105 stop:587 length:483 start_codon:yes stop_codon:yes gene_type:complete
VRLLLTIFLAFSIPENDCSTFYLIRHAEKVRINKTDRDPALNEKGIIRAFNWRDFFIDKDISKIYSTNYKRTLETVKPIEVATGLTAILYSPSSIDYENFISSNKGEIVLVVGHSNTIPDFVNELINDQVYSQIDDLNNSNLYIVNLCDSSISHRLIKVN